MSRIDDLIRELCPAGVRVLSIGTVTHEIGLRNVGARINEVRTVTSAGDFVRTTEYFENARTSIDTSQYKLVPMGAFAYNPSRVNIGSIAQNRGDQTAIVSPMYVVFEVDHSRINGRFFDLWLRSSMGRHSIEARVEEGARFRMPFSTFSQLQMPCPPLAIQVEIVKAMDVLSELGAELGAELDARRTQLGLMVDHLTAGRDEWSRKALGEIGEFYRGRRFTKADYVEAGIPVIHYGEIYTNFGPWITDVQSQVRPELASSLRYALPGDVVITDVGETVDDVGRSVAWIGDSPVAIHDHCFAFRSSMDSKFLSYYMRGATFKADKARHVARTKVKTLLIKGVSRVLIPVPPIDEQRRIAAQLDALDALVSDASIGLPAEIAARRRQYEYYRDKLLTFPEAS